MENKQERAERNKQIRELVDDGYTIAAVARMFNMDRSTALRIIEDYKQVPEFGNNIMCPVCDTEYVHFNEPEYRKGADSYEAWDGRGDAIYIPMWCEEGHAWNMRIGFHKGMSFIKTVEHHDHEVPD